MDRNQRSPRQAFGARVHKRFLLLSVVLAGITYLTSISPLHGAVKARAGDVAKRLAYALPTSGYYGQMIIPAGQHEEPRLHIVLEERGGSHNEVWPAFAYAMAQVPNVRVSTYLAGGEPRYRKTEIANLSATDDTVYEWAGLLKGDLALEEPAEERIDIFWSTTCISGTLRRHNAQLLNIHALRQNKFRLVCVIHHADLQDMVEAHQYLQEWARRDSLILVTLSEHVRLSAHHSLSLLASTTSLGVSYDRVPGFSLVPVWPFPSAMQSLVAEPSADILTTAIIQGNIERGRRDYGSIFTSLIKHIEAEPEAWGWQVHGKNEPYTLANDETAFRLTLLGHNHEGDHFIPPRLADVVHIIGTKGYIHFYEILQNSQLLIPAFSSEDYLEHTASSSIAAAVISRIPVLVTGSHLAAYTYLDQRSAVVSADGIDPIAAIARIRKTGTTLSQADVHKITDPNVLMAFSWPKEPALPEQAVAIICRENVKTMRDILRVQLPDYSYVLKM